MACLFFVSAGADMLRHLPRFEWIPYLCFGTYWLISLPRQVEEPFLTYLRKPRAIASSLLLIVAIAGIGHNLYTAFAR
jgi:hypothetical protein